MNIVTVVTLGGIVIGALAWGTKKDVVIISLMILGMCLVDRVF